MSGRVWRMVYAGDMRAALEERLALGDQPVFRSAGTGAIWRLTIESATPEALIVSAEPVNANRLAPNLALHDLPMPSGVLG